LFLFLTKKKNSGGSCVIAFFLNHLFLSRRMV